MNIIKKWMKTRKQDKNCYALIENKQLSHEPKGEDSYINSLTEAIGTFIKLDKNRVPLKGQLAKLGIKVVDFREPLENEVFVGIKSFISRAELEEIDSNKLTIPGKKTSLKLALDPVYGNKRFILKNIVEPVTFYGLKEEKDITQNETGVSLVAENPLEFNLGKFVPAINGIPVTGTLENVGLEIVACRLPKKGEFFVCKKGKICNLGDIDLDANCGFRFILGKINSEPAKPAKPAKPVQKKSHTKLKKVQTTK